MEGAFGPKEIKKGEKDRFLGEYKERILAYLTFDQIRSEAIYPQIKEILAEPEADFLVIHGSLSTEEVKPYLEMAQEQGLSFRKKNSPDFKGEVALAIVSKKAVAARDRKIMDRQERLQKQGLSDKIIKNVGAYLCKDCWNDLLANAPEEKINYKKISLLDRLAGVDCISCQDG